MAADLAAQTRSERVALVIGNSKYQQTPMLPNPVNDAQAIAETLQRVGFDVVLVNDTTLDQLLNNLYLFYKKAEGADLALFFYAGHGIQFEGQNRLLPVEATLRDPVRVAHETFAVDEILKYMRRAAKTNVLILDACRDNPLLKRLKGTIFSERRGVQVGDGLAKIDDVGSDSLVIFAASAGKTASDGARAHSPFTESLLKHLGERNLDLFEIVQRVVNDVLLETDDDQRPEVMGSIRRKIVINARDEPQTDDSRVWQSIRETRDTRVIEAFRTLFPTSPFAEVARQRVASINEESLRVWETIRSTNSEKVIEAYRAMYPAQGNIDDVATRLALLRTPVPFEFIPFNPNAKPSFNCADYRLVPKDSQNRRPTSEVFCNDSELAEIDRKMGAIYKDYRDGLDASAKFLVLNTQRDWVTTRDRACPATFASIVNPGELQEIRACLKRETMRRLLELEELSKDKRQAQPPAAFSAPAGEQGATTAAPARK